MCVQRDDRLHVHVQRNLSTVDKPFQRVGCIKSEAIYSTRTSSVTYMIMSVALLVWS